MRFLERQITHITIGVGCLVLILMVLQIVIDVLMRSAMGAGFPATSELVSKYYMVAVSFFPIAYAELRRRHVEATIFTDWLSPKGKSVIELFGYLISLAVYGALAWGSSLEAVAQTGRGAYVETGTELFYTWPSYWILPVSFGLMVLVLAMRVVVESANLLFNRASDLPPEAIEILINSEE